MRRLIPLRRDVALGLSLSALLLTGCSGGEPDPAKLATKPAPAPSDLTPEQKRAYDAAVQQAGPTSAAPAGR